MMKTINKIVEYIHPSSKVHLVLEILSCALFALTMFSIPACSFTPGITFVTWIFSALFIIDILLLCILYYKIRIDIINLSLVLFCIAAFISTLINAAFKSFVFTPIILAIFTAIVYTYCISNKKSILPLLLCAYIGIFFFMCLYIVRYFPDLIHFNFTRLGQIFGDENDIALFFTFGSVLGYWFILKFKPIYLKIILSIFTLMFLYCGFSTGSKIFLIEIVLCGIIGAFILVKKDKWWIAACTLVGVAGIVTGLLFLPISKVLRERIADMFITIFNPQQASSTFSYDTSTAIRFDMFLDGMTMFFRKPLFGYGIQGFFRASSFGFAWSHNNISESLCSFGLLGTFLFHFGFIYAFYLCCKTKNKSINDRGILLIFVFFLISMISVALNSQKIYAFVMGICISQFCDVKPICELDFRKRLCHENC